MKRIDRILSEQTNFSRKEIKKLISKGLIYVDDQKVNKPETKFDENNITIKIDDEIIEIKDYIYLVLNKPKGFISTTDISIDNSVLHFVPEKYQKRHLFPVGRLDKDTTGLMILSDDGGFAHNILKPNKHVPKVYEVEIDIPLTKEMQDGFEKGVKLSDGVCKPAILKIIDETHAEVTLTEGRYHQIKRMFLHFGATVTELNRIAIGNFYLPKDLDLGSIREATDEELNKIRCK